MTSSRGGPRFCIGAYQLVERVGAGRTAQVYRAITEDGRTVAVKMLAPEAEVDDPAALARFRREIEALGKMQHPNVIELLDHGVDQEFGPYFVTPFLKGQTLRQLLAACPVCPEAALVLLHHLLQGLGAMHEVGLVHRDLKPENVLVTPDGRLVIIDLGLAYMKEQTRHTDAGFIAGSVPYMSPEQIDGRELDPASDIWSVGVMAHEWVTGERPFYRERQSEEVAAILAGAPRLVAAEDRRVSPEYADLVARCLRADPAERPRTATELGLIVAGQIDWVPFDRLDRELAVLITDPIGYQGQVSGFRVRNLAEEAHRRLGAGEVFEATRVLDRALAYAPGDPGLLALVERAARPAQLATARAPRVGRFGSLLLGVVITTAFAGVASGLGWLRPQRLEPGGALRRPSAAPWPDRTTRALGGKLAPIPPEALSDDDPPLEEELHMLVAPRGEPILGPRALGSAIPEEVLERAEERLHEDRSDLEAALDRAVALLVLGRTADGLAALTALREEGALTTRGWLLAGHVAARLGQFGEAERAYSRALVDDPYHPEALRSRGVLRRRLGETRSGYLDLASAVALSSEDQAAIVELAQVYRHAGRLASARPLFEQLVRLAPAQAESWLALAALQEPPEALASVRRALELDPVSMRGYHELCILLSGAGKPEADPACSRALALLPRSPALWMARAQVRVRAGSYEQALADMTQAIRLDPENPRYYMNRYLANSRAGHAKAAQADLEVACRLGQRTACVAFQ